MLPWGLESVTVTPGSTAPDASAIVPPIAPTPCAIAGSVEHAPNTNTAMPLPTKSLALMGNLPCWLQFAENPSRPSERIHPSISGRHGSLPDRAEGVSRGSKLSGEYVLQIQEFGGQSSGSRLMMGPGLV